ncbi:hypothetical protein FA95DRAFT_1556058 [Auriscalpium vulgare]|uniref:Uncharacterized protein n=1 Tax=Auriscalpium vulgare TaxID=40419 RepID=A0ACB8S1Z3_9AGAM|nr:hypothetical protein FA95DRAFT_1556058 [Auriscalpium vulgare]
MGVENLEVSPPALYLQTRAVYPVEEYSINLKIPTQQHPYWTERKDGEASWKLTFSPGGDVQPSNKDDRRLRIHIAAPLQFDVRPPFVVYHKPSVKSRVSQQELTLVPQPRSNFRRANRASSAAYCEPCWLPASPVRLSLPYVPQIINVHCFAAGR